MIYKIVELSTDKASGHLYVLVHFWRYKVHFGKKPPFRKNDFLMQLRPTGERVVTNIDGWPKQKGDGKFVDPAALDSEKPEPEWEKETYTRDVPAEIRANIEAYWQRSLIEPFPFDHTSHRIKRDNSDPHGVLAWSDVVALRGAKVEKP